MEWFKGKVKEVVKPWGTELIWGYTDKYVGKVLNVLAGHRLSYQYHQQKDETLMLVQGEALITLDGQEYPMELRVPYHVRPFVKHRISAKTNCVLWEVSTSELSDVVRLEDDFGRALSSGEIEKKNKEKGWI